MTPSDDIRAFLGDVERYAGRRFEYPAEIARLMEAATENDLVSAFWQLTFDAKFAVKANDVLRRIGREGEGSGSVSSEFQAAVGRIAEGIRRLVSRTPAAVRTEWEDRFLALEPQSFSNLLMLLGDLAVVKNWEVDGKPLPAALRLSSDRAPSVHPAAAETPPVLSVSPKQIRSILILTLALLAALVLIDPPVTVVGWVLALAIASCVTFLLYHSHDTVTRKEQ